LNNNIKPEIQLLFKDLSNSFKNLEKVETFQKKQRIHLINKLLDENKQLKNELISQKQLINKLQNESNLLKIDINNNNNRFKQNQMQVKEESKPLLSNFFNFGNECQSNQNNVNPKSLVQTQPISRSRITLRPNYSLRDQQMMTSSQTSSRFNRSPMSLTSNWSANRSSNSIKTPINNVLSQRTPSTGYSSIPNISPLTICNRIDRNRITRKVYPFSPNN